MSNWLGYIRHVHYYKNGEYINYGKFSGINGKIPIQNDVISPFFDVEWIVESVRINPLTETLNIQVKDKS